MSEQPPNDNGAAKRAAFEKAFNEFGCFFFSYFKRRLKNRANAEDLNQAFWVQVYKGFSAEQLTQFGLLHYKARQALASYFRYAGVRSIVTVTDEVPEAASEQSPTYANENEVKRLFWAQFPTVQLSDSDRALFWLHANDDCTFRAIEERLGIPASTAQYRYGKICGILRDAYEQE